MIKKVGIKISKNNAQKTDKKETSLRRYFLRILSGLLVVLMGGLIFLWYLSQKPSAGVIRVGQALPDVKSKDQIVFERFEGEYFSFSHSPKYTLKNHEKEPNASGVILESAFFSTIETSSKKIAVTVENLSGRTLFDSANYILRKNNPKLYRMEDFIVGDANGISSTGIGSDGYEKVVFISRDKYLFEIALTAATPEDDALNSEMSEFIKSIQWKK